MEGPLSTELLEGRNQIQWVHHCIWNCNIQDAGWQSILVGGKESKSILAKGWHSCLKKKKKSQIPAPFLPSTS